MDGATGHELIHPDGERTMLLYALDVATTHQGRGHGNDAALATYTSAGGVAEGSGTVMFTWRLAPGNHS